MYVKDEKVTLMRDNIRILALDVDGTLTDGKLHIGGEGELFKSFDVKDGCGIHDILPKCGIKSVIITARESAIVKHRCRELNVDYAFQGIRDKAAKLIELAEQLKLCSENGIFHQIAYMGDDVLDIPIMRICGIKAAPANAALPVLEAANWISSRNGGDGAVRELIDFICASNEYSF